MRKLLSITVMACLVTLLATTAFAQKDDKGKPPRQKPEAKQKVELKQVVGEITAIDAEKRTLTLKPQAKQVQQQQTSAAQSDTPAELTFLVGARTQILLPGMKPKPSGKQRKAKQQQDGQGTPTEQADKGGQDDKGTPEAAQKKRKPKQGSAESRQGKARGVKPEAAGDKPEQSAAQQRKRKPGKQKQPKQGKPPLPAEFDKLEVGQLVQVAFRVMKDKNRAIRIRVLKDTSQPKPGKANPVQVDGKQT